MAGYTELKKETIFRLQESVERILKCIELLEDTDIWYQPNENSNSVHNLILHLCGNIGQYINAGLGAKTDTRNRESEFLNNHKYDKSILKGLISDAVKDAIKVIEDLDISQLLKKYDIQGFNLTGIAVLVHVVEHTSYHVGQITYFTKIQKNISTDYYKGIDLTQRNH